MGNVQYILLTACRTWKYDLYEFVISAWWIDCHSEDYGIS